MNVRFLGKTHPNFQSRGPNGGPRATHVTHPRLRALPRAASTRAGWYLGKSSVEIAIDLVERSKIKLDDEKWTAEKPRDALDQKSDYAAQLDAAKQQPLQNYYKQSIEVELTRLAKLILIGFEQRSQTTKE